MSLFKRYTNTLTKRYATFSGRANRNEYCAFLLVYHICVLLVTLFPGVSSEWMKECQEAVSSHDNDAIERVIRNMDLGFLCIILLKLLHLIPLVGLLVRRAHDLNTSGWWIVGACVLLMVSPLLSSILRAVLVLLPGTLGPNQYGLPPAKKDELTLSNYLLVGLLISAP